MKSIACVITILIILSCDNYNRLTDKNRDITPPDLLKIEAISRNSIILEFDEGINFIESSYISRENLKIANFLYHNNSIEIVFKSDMIPGHEYCTEFKFEDNYNNYTYFISKFYGFNPIIPTLLINEFICKGTDTNPDKVELYVKRGGNMAGVTLFNGVSKSYDSIFIFPDITVNTGDYIVIRSVTDRYPNEHIERDNIDFENDSKFIAGVRDIRTKDFYLSGTNGVLSLYTNPFGKLMDGVIYTKNNNDPDKNYRNFGLKKTVTRVDIITDEEGWTGSENCIFPNDCINIEGSTTTRSLNRKDLNDSDSKEDWYTVPTGMSSFGYQNNIEVY